MADNLLPGDPWNFHMVVRLVGNRTHNWIGWMVSIMFGWLFVNEYNFISRSIIIQF